MMTLDTATQMSAAVARYDAKARAKRDDLNRAWGAAAVRHAKATRALYRAEIAGRKTTHLRENEREAWTALCGAKSAAEAANAIARADAFLGMTAG
jgi:hypothetical protein